MAVTLHTSHGDVKVELFCELAPLASENFLALCASGYYNGTIFHRNIKGFMLQGGDPKGTGKGGQSIWGRPFQDEFSEELKHDRRGILSMANSGPSSNGSQFFFTYSRHAHLDHKYTVFGHIIDGIEFLDACERIPVDERDKPKNPITINSVTIHANPIAGQKS